MDLEKMNNDVPRLDDGSIDYALASRKMYIMGVRRGAEFIRAMVDEVRARERERIVKFIEFQGTTPRKSIKETRNLGDET